MHARLRHSVSVKHLNPRQGITTTQTARTDCGLRRSGACETPKSPPGDYNTMRIRIESPLSIGAGVKHLNPRQGITTYADNERIRRGSRHGVKHLNPRQGITTIHAPVYDVLPDASRCETPKSPPGDYNRARSRDSQARSDRGVKHLNPRQGITTTSGARQYVVV